MKMINHSLIMLLAWMFLVDLTHRVVFGAVNLCFDVASWGSDLTFFIIAFFYVYIFIRYSVRIEIYIENKQIFYYRNRRK